MNRIRELRKKAKMTMKELGKSVGLAESTISLYETGKHEPDLDTLRRFADIFGVSVDYILGRDVPVSSDQPNAPDLRATRRAEAHDMLEKLSDENYQAMLTLLRSMTEKKG